jgi:hypothetical protein
MDVHSHMGKSWALTHPNIPSIKTISLKELETVQKAENRCLWLAHH